MNANDRIHNGSVGEGRMDSIVMNRYFDGALPPTPDWLNAVHVVLKVGFN